MLAAVEFANHSRAASIMPVRVPRSSLVLAALLVASGCRSGEPRVAPSVPVAAPVAAPDTTAPVAAPVSAPVAAPAEPAPPELAGPAPLVVTPPGDPPASDAAAKPLQKIATWPFTAWDRAEAIGFNHVAYGPGIPLRVYDDVHGWSPKIVERRAITAQQGARAVQWVIATRGGIEVSKCAFPRHAVVLYAGDTPVGTANVCFECGDILVWPDLEPPPDDDRWSDAKQKQQERKFRQQLSAYKKVFPQWEQFFGDELGFSLAPVRGP